MTRPPSVAFAGFLLFTVLAVAHLPVVTFEQDSIGLFDLAVLAFGVMLLVNGRRIGAPAEARPVMYGYVLFLGYITIGYLIGTLRNDFRFFATALLVKQYEYLLVALVAGHLVAAVPRRSLLIPLGLILFIVSIAGAVLFSTSGFRRLGLLFQAGNSPNPAAFILATTLLLLITDARSFLNGRGLLGKLWFTAALGAGVIALVMTFSRTNSLAFVIALGFYLLQRNRRIFFAGAILMVGILVVLSAIPAFLGVNAYGGELFTSFLLDPLSVFKERTFQMRLTQSWFLGFSHWSGSPWTILFGIGFGGIRVTDGLVPNLLYSTGFVGLSIYLSMLGYLFARGTPALRTMILFVLLNSVSTETTINSFRSMQVFLVSLSYLMRYHLRPHPIPASLPHYDLAGEGS